MENTTIETVVSLNWQEAELIKSYLVADAKEPYVTNTDKFIIHGILAKIEQKEL